ncbi:MAG TPA: putative Ig domain-containing protein [Candidatus Udaeobacter sp.]|nr:putative Ig domain-containing protein [Candidatus Udaeobacter sp.]
MWKVRLGALLVGLVLIVTACGRIPPASSATETPSPSPAVSPAAGNTPLTVPGPSLHMGEVGLAYTPVTYEAVGGSVPYVWRISNGLLPGGLDMSPDGAISGTPTAAGTFNFTVEVTDAGIATANVSGAITVVPTLTVSLVRSGTITARQGSPASGAFGSQVGGNPPYTYSVSSGSMPGGTSLNGLSLAGTFSSAGTYHFTITVSDSLGRSATVSPTYYVWGPIAFPPLCDPSGPHCPPPADQIHDVWMICPNAAGCTGAFNYTGGTPGVTPIATYSTRDFPGAAGTPNGLTVSVYGGAVHVTVAPNANPNPSSWYSTVYVALTDPATNETTRAAVFRVEWR